eukprot:6124184-Amphidinium_carterae.2
MRSRGVIVLLISAAAFAFVGSDTALVTCVGHGCNPPVVTSGGMSSYCKRSRVPTGKGSFKLSRLT